jgi:predicted permease
MEGRIRRGMTPAEARRTALADLGGMEQVKEGVRSASAGAWLDTIGQDLRSACRALQHSRGYTAWVVGSLTIGIGVTVAALALLNASLLMPFGGVRDQKRLVRVSVSRNCGRSDCWTRMSTPTDYEALREGLTGLQGLAAYTIGELPVALPAARSMRVVFASQNYFDVLGVHLEVGRGLNSNDAAAHDAVAIISHNVWIREFDADPSVVGRTLRVADQFVEVVGVAPALFVGIDRDRPGAPRSMTVGRAPDVWLPVWLADRLLPFSSPEQRRQERDLSFVGRLRDDVPVSRVQTEARTLALRLAETRDQASQGALADVQRLWRVNPRAWQFGVIVVLPIPILVLVIACVNAANLMLARGSQRRREIAIRLAIGAGRGRIVRQLLIESAGLALIATAVAIPIARWGLQLASNPLNTPIPLDATVLGLAVLTAVLTTMAFGLAPAIRVSAEQPSSALGSVGARSDAMPGQSRMRRLLVVAQVALSLGLLATGSQLIGTVRAQAVSAGTPADRLLIARFDLQPFKSSPAAIESFYRDLLVGASRLPGAEAAGLARQSSVWTLGQGAAPASIVVWRPADRPDEGRITTGGFAGGNLFDAVGVRVVSGRTFTEADRQTRPQVAVVNEAAAKMLNGPAVGALLRVAPRGQDFASGIEVRVVGVIESTREPRLEPDDPPDTKVYLPSPLEPEPALAVYVRTRDTATTIAQPLRELAGRIDPRVPILEIGSLEDFNERSYATPLWLARAAAVLGVVGLLLATAGLYGVSSYVVALRSREMAIRMAVGATSRSILMMMLGQSMRVAMVGLLVGGGAAIAVSRVIQSEYHGIRRIDGAAFAGAAFLFLATMLLASVIPAIRASRVDPVQNLKDG